MILFLKIKRLRCICVSDVCENKQESRLNVLDRNLKVLGDDNIKNLEFPDMKVLLGLLEINK